MVGKFKVSLFEIHWHQIKKNAEGTATILLLLLTTLGGSMNRLLPECDVDLH